MFDNRRLKKILFVSILITILIQPLLPLVQATITAKYYPLTVDSAVYSDPYQFPCNTRSFTAYGRNYVFYIDIELTTHEWLVYKSKPVDSLTYSAATNVLEINEFTLQGTFDICFNNETGKVLLAVVDVPNYDVLYRMGTPDATGVITWAAAFQTVYNGGVSTYPFAVSVFRAETPYASGTYYDFVAYVRQNAGGYDTLYVAKSATNDGTWTQEFNTIIQTSANLGYFIQATYLGSRGAGSLTIIYHYNGRLYGEDWTAPGGWTGIETGPKVNSPGCWSATYEQSIIHVTFSNSTAGSDKLCYTPWTGVWDTSSDVIIQDYNLGGSMWVPAISLDSNTTLVDIVFANVTGFYYVNGTTAPASFGSVISLGSDPEGCSGQYQCSIDQQSWIYRIPYYWESDSGALKSLSLPESNSYVTVTDPDDIQYFATWQEGNLYSYKKYYNIEVKTGAVEDVSSVSVKLLNLSTATAFAYIRGDNLDTTPVWTILGTPYPDPNIFLGTCSWDGVNSIAEIKIEIKWQFPDIPGGVGLEYSFVDIYATNSTWLNDPNGYYFINDLTVTNFASNATSCVAGHKLLMSGDVRYATTVGGFTPSSSYPPNGLFTSVDIQDDEFNTVGTDTTIISGAFSCVVTSSSVIRTTTYYAYLNLLPDYVDGLSADGRHVTVTTTTYIGSYSLVGVLTDAFDYWSGQLGAPTGVFTVIKNVIFAWFPYLITWGTAFVAQLTNMLVFINAMITMFGYFITTIMGVVSWLVTGGTSVLSMIVMPIGILVAFFQGGSYVMPAAFGGQTISFAGISTFMSGIQPLWTPLFFIALLVWFIRDGPLAIPGKVMGVFNFSYAFFLSVFSIVFWTKDRVMEAYSYVRSLMSSVI